MTWYLVKNSDNFTLPYHTLSLVSVGPTTGRNKGAKPPWNQNSETVYSPNPKRASPQCRKCWVS